MRRLKNRSHPPATPMIWKSSSGHKIQWHSARQPFEVFYAEVVAYSQQNGGTVPSEEEVENTICSQLAGFWCTNAPKTPLATHRNNDPAVKSTTQPRCGSCGKKK